MGKNLVYAVLLIGGALALVFYAYPKYKEATGQNIIPSQSGPPAKKSDDAARGDGY